MAKKKQKTTDPLNLESILFNCREYLRSNASLNDKRDLLLTLVFMRFIGEKFENTQKEMRQECLDNGITDEEVIKSFLDSPNRYKGIAYVPEKSRWSTIMEQPASKLNAALDDAIHHRAYAEKIHRCRVRRHQLRNSADSSPDQILAGDPSSADTHAILTPAYSAQRNDLRRAISSAVQIAPRHSRTCEDGQSSPEYQLQLTDL